MRRTAHAHRAVTQRAQIDECPLKCLTRPGDFLCREQLRNLHPQPLSIATVGSQQLAFRRTQRIAHGHLGADRGRRGSRLPVRFHLLAT